VYSFKVTGALPPVTPDAGVPPPGPPPYAAEALLIGPKCHTTMVYP
jgi:hypothetical protein